MFGFIAFVVSVAVASAGWAQVHIARQKLALDLFEKRHAAYREFRAAISDLSIKGGADFDAVYRVERAAHEMRFLFGDDITERARAASEAAFAWLRAERQYARASTQGGSDLGAIFARATDAQNRVLELEVGLDELLMPYLRMDQKLPRPPHEWPAIWLGWLNRQRARVSSTEAWKDRPFQKRD